MWRWAPSSNRRLVVPPSSKREVCHRHEYTTQSARHGSLLVDRPSALWSPEAIQLLKATPHDHLAAQHWSLPWPQRTLSIVSSLHFVCEHFSRYDNDMWSLNTNWTHGRNTAKKQYSGYIRARAGFNAAFNAALLSGHVTSHKACEWGFSSCTASRLRSTLGPSTTIDPLTFSSCHHYYITLCG